MTTPATSALVYYTATQLTGTDWKTNFDQIVAWLANGAADLSVGSVTAAGDVTVGDDLTVGGDLAVTGSITGRFIRNIESVSLADNFSSSSSGAWATRTGATVSITTTVPSGTVRLSVRSTWSLTLSNVAGTYFGWISFRINVDSGSSYRTLGGIYHTDSGNSVIYSFVGGDTIFSGLSAGAHTFTLECKRSLGSAATNLCATVGGSENMENTCELIAEEL